MNASRSTNDNTENVMNGIVTARRENIIENDNLENSSCLTANANIVNASRLTNSNVNANYTDEYVPIEAAEVRILFKFQNGGHEPSGLPPKVLKGSNTHIFGLIGTYPLPNLWMRKLNS